MPVLQIVCSAIVTLKKNLATSFTRAELITVASESSGSSLSSESFGTVFESDGAVLNF